MSTTVDWADKETMVNVDTALHRAITRCVNHYFDGDEHMMFSDYMLSQGVEFVSIANYIVVDEVYFTLKWIRNE